MILQNDPSMRPGWVTPFIDGSGWTGTDAVCARQQDWDLEIGPLGMAVCDRVGVYLGYIYQDCPPIEDESFAHLLERVMIGDKLSFKALYLMVHNDPRYAEWRPTVEAVQSDGRPGTTTELDV